MCLPDTLAMPGCSQKAPIIARTMTSCPRSMAMAWRCTRYTLVCSWVMMLQSR